jgi:hypothetical protein
LRYHNLVVYLFSKLSFIMPENTGLSSGEKIGIVSVIGIFLGGVIYYLVKKSRSNVVIPITSSKPGETYFDAVDPDDEQAFQDIVKEIKNSSFSDSLSYLAEILPNYMTGGVDESADSFGTVLIHGQKFTPKSSALLNAMWNGWSSSVIANDFNRSEKTPVIPQAGYSQSQAEEARKLLEKASQIWLAYKTKRLKNNYKL